MTRVLSEEELAARDALRQRMAREQELRDAAAPKVGNRQVNELDLERCPHGIPLRKSCPKCDVVTPDQIQDSVPYSRT